MRLAYQKIVHKLKSGPENEHLAEKWSFKGNHEIVRTIFQPRALSSDISASQKEFICSTCIQSSQKDLK